MCIVQFHPIPFWLNSYRQHKYSCSQHFKSYKTQNCSLQRIRLSKKRWWCSWCSYESFWSVCSSGQGWVYWSVHTPQYLVLLSITVYILIHFFPTAVLCQCSHKYFWRSREDFRTDSAWNEWRLDKNEASDSSSKLSDSCCMFSFSFRPVFLCFPLFTSLLQYIILCFLKCGKVSDKWFELDEE